MILKKVKLQNFKQFAENQEFEINTKGKITVIYGFNGYGKTRLHSFFHWLFYGYDREKETIYNKPKMRQTFSGDELTVYGEIIFEHNGSEHILYRSETYKKTDVRVYRSDSDFKIRRIDDHGNARFMSNPSEIVSEILPEELSDYFFFDGEGMASELVGDKNATSNKGLKEAVNTLFGLKLYENAIKDIGSLDRKNCAISELANRVKDNGSSKPETYRNYINHYSEQRESLVDMTKKLKEEIDDLNAKNRSLSEIIGKKDNLQTLNNERATLKKTIDDLGNDRKKLIRQTGKLVSENLSYYIVSKNIRKVQNIIKSKIKDNYVSGLDNKIVNNILDKRKCICGNDIKKEEQESLQMLLEMLPPHSYNSIFHDYKKEAESKLTNSHEALQLIRDSIVEISDKGEKITNHYNRIEQIDEELSKLKSIENAVKERKDNEMRLREKEQKLQDKNAKASQIDTDINRATKKLKDLMKNNKHNQEVDTKIGFLEDIRDSLQLEYENRKSTYRTELESNIKSLVNNMLSVNRDVELNDNYTISVKDNYDSSVLSAGQAAIISFAYIGGILNSLKKMDVEYVSSNYPLILDAPLSHLDVDHIEKVFKFLPKFSNQLIIFSKEKIDDYVKHDKKTMKYQIMSNEEANLAKIKAYSSPDYFTEEEKRRLH